MKKLFLTATLLFFPLVSLAHYGDDTFFGHHMMDGIGRTGWGGYGIFGAGIFMIILWAALIIGVIYLLFRGASGHGCGHWLGHGEHKPKEKGDNAAGILKERYAKGEITKDDFEKMKKDLE